MATTAKKIKLFQFLRQYYPSIGIHPPESNPNHRFDLKFLFFLFIETLICISLIAFVSFEAKTVIEFGTGFYIVLLKIVAVLFFLIQLWKMDQILKLIDHFEDFIKKRVQSNVNSWAKYNELNEKIEKMSKLINVTLRSAAIYGIAAPSLLITIVNYFVYDLKDESYFLASPIVLPFNWKTPFGYMIAFLAQSTATVSTGFCFAPIMILLIGSCCLLKTFANEITDDLRLLDVDNGTKQSERKVKERFCKAVQLFADAKQLVNEINCIFEFITTTFFLWSLLAIASSLLVVHKALSQDNFNPIELFIQLVFMVLSLAFVSLFCEIGEMVFDHFDKVDQQLFNCNWYKFPIEIQRMLVIVTANTQQPVTVRGYGNVLCRRDTLKKTTNCGFSYFAMLRQVDA